MKTNAFTMIAPQFSSSNQLNWNSLVKLAKNSAGAGTKLSIAPKPQLMIACFFQLPKYGYHWRNVSARTAADR